ncbi:MAG: sugar kinase [Pseudomonadota bacterium]
MTSKDQPVAGTVICFGEVLLRLTPPGRQLLLQGSGFDAWVGGAEANVAVSLSRMGHRASLVSVLPASPLGEACRSELHRHGVGSEHIQMREGRMGLYFMTQGAGPRASEVLYDRRHSAFAEAPPNLFDWAAVLQGAAWLHVSGITPAVSDAAGEAALAAVTTARQLGVKVSFDCNFRARVWEGRAAGASRILSALCKQADLIFGDERDIAFMLGFDAASVPPEALRRQAANAAFQAFTGLKWLAMTLRTRHSADQQDLTGQLYSATEQWGTRAWPLGGIVDRIGAGDAFAAGLLHSLITGKSPQDGIAFATAAACLKHMIPGDFNLLGAEQIDLALTEGGADVRR